MRNPQDLLIVTFGLLAVVDNTRYVDGPVDEFVGRRSNTRPAGLSEKILADG
jgi:hypothetical protein